MFQSKIFKLIVGSLGIFSVYLIVSVLNQRIFTHQYQYPSSHSIEPPSKEEFQFPDLLICFTSLFCGAFALLTTRLIHLPPSTIPTQEKLWAGFLYTVNVMAISYASLYIPYPVRVVTDKIGYLAAVVVGIYFSRLSRSSKLALKKSKLIVALLITGGTALFTVLYQKNRRERRLFQQDEQWYGYLLLLISIIAEAFFNDSQAYLKVTYKPHILHFMFAANRVTFIISFIKLVFNQELMPAVEFCFNHEEIARDILLIALLSIGGQVSIYYIVLNFKQHIFPLISTIRKVFTIMLSIYVYRHKISAFQWTALVMIFGGALYELVDELYNDYIQYLQRRNKAKQIESKEKLEESVDQQKRNDSVPYVQDDHIS